MTTMEILDPLLHQPLRTQLACFLAGAGEATFSELKRRLDVSDGNLDSHLKILSTWTTPVAVSLLLHAALVVLVMQQLSNNSTDKRQIQAITVELSGLTSTVANKPREREATPTPVQEPVQTDQTMVTNPIPEEVQKTTATQINTATPETTQTSLNVQPLSKVTRKPAPLNKIDLVYPPSEQRSGNQAYVLASFIIDEKGNVQDVKIVKSAGTDFDNAVNNALIKSIFAPGYIDTEAVAVRVLQKFSFNLM